MATRTHRLEISGVLNAVAPNITGALGSKFPGLHVVIGRTAAGRGQPFQTTFLKIAEGAIENENGIDIYGYSVTSQGSTVAVPWELSTYEAKVHACVRACARTLVTHGPRS